MKNRQKQISPRVLILGGNGQLGSDLTDLFGEDAIGLTHREIEVTDEKSIISNINKYNPQIIINTTAYHNVDLCEQNPREAFSVNAVALFYLSKICTQRKIKLVHISTDYVFDGKKKRPYREDDQTSPLNIYGISKMAGESIVKNYCPYGYIIRTCGLFGKTPCLAKGTNFVLAMLKIAKEKGKVSVVNDQIVSPTYVYDLARQIKVIITKAKPGLYHVTSKSSCTWYDFAKEIFRLSNTKVKLIPIKTDIASFPVARPLYSVLSHSKINRLKINIMRPWKSALKDYLSQMELD